MSLEDVCSAALELAAAVLLQSPSRVSGPGLAAWQHCRACAGLQPALSLVNTLSAHKRRGTTPGLCQACTCSCSLYTCYVLCDVRALLAHHAHSTQPCVYRCQLPSPLAGPGMCFLAAHQPGPCDSGAQEWCAPRRLAQSSKAWRCTSNCSLQQ